MRKIKIIFLTILILIILNTNVLAISTAHIATSTATRTAIMTTTTAGMAARRNRYTTEKAIEEIFNETQNEELKNYISENEQYLYLANKDKAEAVINKYKESNLEETKQFIKDNYFDENKPEKEKRAMIILTILIVIIIIFAVILIITA